MPFYKTFDRKYWVTELVPVFDTDEVNKQIKTNEEVKKDSDHSPFHKLCRADNGALYYYKKRSRTIRDDKRIKETPLGFEKQRRERRERLEQEKGPQTFEKILGAGNNA